jgi:hypothetical protein
MIYLKRYLCYECKYLSKVYKRNCFEHMCCLRIAHSVPVYKKCNWEFLSKNVQ